MRELSSHHALHTGHYVREDSESGAVEAVLFGQQMRGCRAANILCKETLVEWQPTVRSSRSVVGITDCGAAVKNYPNQASNFARVRGTLEVIKDLRDRGIDVSDDGTLGREAALRRVYTFLLDYSAPTIDNDLRERLAQEEQKSSGNQGMRTFARELRRTLLDLGWLSPHSFDLTAEGEALLASTPGSLTERELLSDGLLQLQVTDKDGNTSHPVRVMLELLSVAPSLQRDGLELALEARDDSPQEIARVKELYRLPRPERQAALGATQYQIANAKKIFPALARTAGLVIEDAQHYYHLSPDGRVAIAAPAVSPVSGPGTTPRRQRTTTTSRRDVQPRRPQAWRQVTPETVAGRAGSATATGLTPEEQERARQLLAERTDRHQDLVRRTVRHIVNPGTFFESVAAFDLLWEPEDSALPLVLFEMKTINRDARSQTRQAFSQLRFYHYFDVSPRWPERGVIEVAVYDRHPGAEMTRFLEHEGVLAVLVGEDGSWQQINALEPDLPHLLGIA